MAFLIFASTVLSVAVQVFGGNSNNESSLLQRMSEIKKLINPAVDPCQNFYQYACGNYDRVHPIPDYKGKFDVLDAITEENYKIINQTLSDSNYSTSSSAIKKAQILYKSCLNTSAINQRGDQPLQQFLKKFGGWPVINQYWSEKTFDWLQTAIEMQITFNDNFLFDSLVQPNFLTGSGIQGILIMGPKVLSNRNFVLYEEKIRNALKKFGVQIDLAAKTAADVINFEKGLKNLTSPGSTSQNVSSLMATHPTFDWQKWVTGVFGSDFDPSDLITITRKGCVTNLAEYIKKVGPKSTANYLLWRGVEKLMEVMGDEFMTVVNDYNVKLGGFLTAAPRWRHCVEIVSKVMSSATASILAANTNPKHIADFFNETLNRVKTVMKKSILKSDWLDSNSATKALEKLDATEINLDYQKVIYNQSLLDQEYKNVDVNYEKFFESYVLLNELEFKRYAKVIKSKSREFILPENLLISAEAIYNLMRNDLTLTQGILRPPLYSSANSKELKLSTIGFIIAHEIVHGFDNIGFVFNAKGGFRPVYKWEQLENRISCFKNQISEYKINDIPVPSSFQIIAEAMSDSLGLKSFYEVFEHLEQSKKNQQFDSIASSLGLTNKKLIFVSVAQTLCATIRKEATKGFIKGDGHSIGENRVNQMILNNEYFANVFKCAVDSPMITVNKCSLF